MIFFKQLTFVICLLFLAGSLLGVKFILNEFVAYINLSGIDANALSEKSRLIMLYALCGFANL